MISESIKVFPAPSLWYRHLYVLFILEYVHYRSTSIPLEVKAQNRTLWTILLSFFASFISNWKSCIFPVIPQPNLSRLGIVLKITAGQVLGDLLVDLVVEVDGVAGHRVQEVGNAGQLGGDCAEIAG